MNRYKDANNDIHTPCKLCGALLNVKKPRRHFRWAIPAIAAAAAAAILLGATLWPNGSPLITSAYAISEAEYPEMSPYPDENSIGFERAYEKWREDKLTQRNQPEGYADGLDGFIAATAQEFLSGANGENRVYSPLNIYMALSMLAELTGGESRGQILDLLEVDSIEALRIKANAVWNANYCDDGAYTSILASSVWLSDTISFNQSTMDTLAETYYASSYQGAMGSENLNEAFRAWINQQTGGLLTDQAEGLELDGETILALAATVYFNAKWRSQYSESKTTEEVFHTDSGDVVCDFMHKTDEENYFWGGKFGAIRKGFEDGGTMWFILPDEGVPAEELLYDGETMALIMMRGSSSWENRKYLIVNESIPKFDVTSSIDLAEGLQNLGITDIFSPESSDFSPTTGADADIYLSSAQHAVRVTVDEEGVTAAAFTALATTGAAEPPDDEIDFVLDRPFLFVIAGTDGLPLFIGIVNTP
ncbi:MAG: serpin family protein [Oscillospiraceae bacterium]